MWDSLIEQFNSHLLGGTQEFATHAGAGTGGEPVSLHKPKSIDMKNPEKLGRTP